jgi:hypothetical protein
MSDRYVGVHAMQTIENIHQYLEMNLRLPWQPCSLLMGMRVTTGRGVLDPGFLVTVLSLFYSLFYSCTTCRVVNLNVTWVIGNQRVKIVVSATSKAKLTLNRATSRGMAEIDGCSGRTTIIVIHFSCLRNCHWT